MFGNNDPQFSGFFTPMTLLLLHLVRNGLVFTRVVYWMPPFSEANVSLQAPHFGNPARTPLPEEKLSAPPPPDLPPQKKVKDIF